MKYTSLYERKQHAHAEAARKGQEQATRDRERHEEEAQREQERAREAQRDATLSAGNRLLKKVNQLGSAALNLIRDYDELGNTIDKNHEFNADILGGSLYKRVVLMTKLFAIGLSGAILDFYFLSGGASFLLALAGITLWVALVFGKLVVPILIIGFELASAAEETEGKPRRFAYLLPVVVATLAGATYIGHAGITSLDTLTPINIFLTFVVIAFGLVLHYTVIRMAKEVFKGLTIAVDLYQGWRYTRLGKKVEEASNVLFASVIDWLDSYDVLRRDYGVDRTPPFHLIPDEIRQLINEKAGYELIPRPSRNGGDGAALNVG